MNFSSRLCGFTAAAALLGAVAAQSLSAWAAGPKPSSPAKHSAAVTHLCKPHETVGFSCELHDRRLLSMCASPGFAAFDGLPKDNPGYAYLAIGTPAGVVQHSYPPNPNDYKMHFYKGVPTNGIPYMFVTSEKGRFFFLAEQDDTDPSGAGTWTSKNLPEGWSVNANHKGRACARVLEFDNFSEMGVTHDSVWFSGERQRVEAENAKPKAKKP